MIKPCLQRQEQAVTEPEGSEPVSVSAQSQPTVPVVRQVSSHPLTQPVAELEEAPVAELGSRA